MISRHNGGETVKSGIYWSKRAGEFISVPAEGGVLEGGAGDQYLRTPVLLVLLLGPVMGLVFAIFLPLSGLLVLVPFLAGKLRDTIAPAKMPAAHMASPRMQPGLSYLEPKAGASKKDPEAEGEEPEGKIVDLAQEIAEKRWQGK